MSENEVPLLDLAPKLKRPLSLWNPLDYLRLLYWIFLFPQALHWYEREFGKHEYQNAEGYEIIKKVFRKDFVRRQLVFQAVITLIATEFLTAWGFAALGIPINFLALAVGGAVGVTIGALIGAIDSVAFGVTFGVALSVAGSIIGGVAFAALEKVTIALALGISLAIAGSVALTEKFMPNGLGEVVGTGIGVSISLSFVLTFALNFLSAVVFMVTFNIFLIRPFDFLLLGVPGSLFWKSGGGGNLCQASRIVCLPLPGLQKQLENWLMQNWTTGLYNAQQLLIYSMQYAPVREAIKLTLNRLELDSLLPKVTMLINQSFDWDIISPFQYNESLDEEYVSELNSHLNTQAEVVCAGFWFWHKKRSADAVKAFSIVRELPHGPEIYGIAHAIDRGIKVTNSKAIADMEDETNWLDSLPAPELRPGTLRALRMLHSVAGEARVALNARAPLNRSSAINRAVADLTTLIETSGSFCPEPEWSLIQDIARKWKEIFTREGGVIGEEVLRQAVSNPYEGYSGLPVTGSSFTGRTGIMSQIETHWTVGGPMPVLILYGHRRMGKTSVLRNLSQNTDLNNLYVYLDMQNAGWIEHTGQLLLDFAEAVHKAVSQSGLDTGPAPDHTDYSGLDTARRSFNTFLDRIDAHMTETKRLILAVDEFELIEQGIREKRIDPGLLRYLRSINQQYPWLGLIFAGLHTLDEMGRDYQSAFYGQAHYLRLGYLSREDALKLITQPHPDFALEYGDALIDEIYRLTFGQPYLVQLLCWELVNRWNDRFLEPGESTPRILKIDDLAPVLTPDFYQGAGYYFEGVWSNATENEQHLMRILATYETHPPSKHELETEAKKSGFPTDPEIMEETLKLLARHDIITETETGPRFASELMRRWVEKQGKD